MSMGGDLKKEKSPSYLSYLNRPNEATNNYRQVCGAFYCSGLSYLCVVGESRSCPILLDMGLLCVSVCLSLFSLPRPLGS